MSTPDRDAALAQIPPTPPYVQACPWTSATPDRIARTTTVPCGLPVWVSLGADDPICVGPRDPTTGERYFCIALDADARRFDYALSPAGDFSMRPPSSDRSFRYWVGFAYGIDEPSGQHVVLVSGNWKTGPNSLHWVRVDQPEQPMQTYAGDEAFSPAGLWITGALVWIYMTDGSLWNMALADVLAGSSGSLRQVGSAGVVQGVTWNLEPAAAAYWALSYVQQPNGSWSLVEFPTDSPDHAVVLEANVGPPSYDWYSQTGGPRILVTPDGAVWRVSGGYNLAGHGWVPGSLALLAPSFPVGGPVPTWFDPTADVVPGLQSASSGDTICFIPFSATNVLLVPKGPHFDGDLLSVHRLGVGVLDQPPTPFPVYAGDEATAYANVSGSLINGHGPPFPVGTTDIRVHYGTLSAAQAGAYVTALNQLQMPTGLDPAAWNAVVDQLWYELYNLVSALSFWESMRDLTDLRDAINQHALSYVSNVVTIPATAIPVDASTADVDAMNIAAGALGSAADVATMATVILGASSAVAPPLAFLAAGAALASAILTVVAAESAGWRVDINDPGYMIAVKLSEVENQIGPAFTQSLSLIASYSQTCASDMGALGAVGQLSRNGTWYAQPPTDMDPTIATEEYPTYYKECVVTYLKAFVPLVAAAQRAAFPGVGPVIYADYAKAGPERQVTHAGVTYNAQTLQQADEHLNLLGQDLDPILFDQFQIDPEDVFFNWGLPSSPFWPPFKKH